MKHFLKFGLFLILVGCGAPAIPPPPENALPEKKFVAVMVDLHLIEAGVNQKITPLNDSTHSTYRYYKYLFEKHEINRVDFDSTYGYYQRYPELMNEVYTQVFDSLKALSDDLTENEEKYRKMEKAVRDSLPAVDSLLTKDSLPPLE